MSKKLALIVLVVLVVVLLSGCGVPTHGQQQIAATSAWLDNIAQNLQYLFTNILP